MFKPHCRGNWKQLGNNLEMVGKYYSPKKYAPMNAPTVATKPIINTV